MKFNYGSYFYLSEWLLFISKWAIFKLYHITFNEMRYFQSQTICSLKIQSADRHVAPLDTLSWFQPTSLCSFSLMPRAQRRRNQYQFYSVGLTRPGLEPTIYRTRGEHVNHYTIDAVCAFIWTKKKVKPWYKDFQLYLL
jgi:hypothetical protein